MHAILEWCSVLRLHAARIGLAERVQQLHFAAPLFDIFWKVPYLSPVSSLLMFLTDWASEVCFSRALNLMEYEFSWSVMDLSCNYHKMNAVLKKSFSNWLVGILIVILPYSCLKSPWSTYFFVIPCLCNRVLYT